MSLATSYLGLHLAHPIVAAASPLTATLDGMRRLEDAGAAAVVSAAGGRTGRGGGGWIQVFQTNRMSAAETSASASRLLESIDLERQVGF